MTEEKIKEIHHHHYYYPCYIPQTKYPGVWHSILPPPVWHYEPIVTTTTTSTTKAERYDSI